MQTNDEKHAAALREKMLAGLTLAQAEKVLADQAAHDAALAAADKTTTPDADADEKPKTKKPAK